MLGRRPEGSSITWTRTNRKSYNRPFPCLNYRRPSSSDNERPSGSRRPPPFLNDDDDDDEDEVPMTLDNSNRQHDRSSSNSASSPTVTVNVNPIRQPTAFAAPNPITSGSSGGGPTFYHYKDKTKTPMHAAMSADGTSMFCVEGYVNTPELSAGRGGGLSQGLPATGPYKSLFRAGSRSESRASASASNHYKNNAAAAPALHVLAEAAQSP
ncbi:hypothetical protein F5888DRAFT_907636 [Russula emetica]|nr:hypothetical protein F5888DRAFT_907636 [Russula emetica]